MLDLTIIGIALQGDAMSPSLLLYPFGTEKVIFLPLDPTDAFTLSAALHGPAGNDEAPRRDLTARLLHHLGGRLQEVEISGFGTGSLRATAVILSGSATVRLRCRPAEGVLLSLQCGAPLRAEDDALSAAKSLDDPTLELSAHVRTLARTAMLRDKLEDGSEDGRFDFSRIPLVLEGRARREEHPAQTITLTVHKKTAEPAPTGGVALSGATPAGGPPEEDRWATLLQVLAPETKTPM